MDLSISQAVFSLEARMLGKVLDEINQLSKYLPNKVGLIPLALRMAVLIPWGVSPYIN